MRQESPSQESRQSHAGLWIVAALVLLAVFGLAIRKTYLSGAEEDSVDADFSPAPAFDLAGLDGSRHRLRDYSGRVLLIEFWATWCGPCRLQAEILSRLYDDVRGDDMEFLAVSLGESKDLVEDYTRKDPVPYPVLLDPEETLGYALEIYALPTVIIIDRRGQISFMRPGISDGDTLRRALSAAAESREKVASN